MFFLLIFRLVTLIGAHSLGHTHIANSGFGFIDPSKAPSLLNAWDATPATLDNGFFIELTRNVSQANVSCAFLIPALVFMFVVVFVAVC